MLAFFKTRGDFRSEVRVMSDEGESGSCGSDKSDLSDLSDGAGAIYCAPTRGRGAGD